MPCLPACLCTRATLKSLAALPAFGALEAIAFHLLPRFFVPEACGTAWIYEAGWCFSTCASAAAPSIPWPTSSPFRSPNAHGIRVERTITEGTPFTSVRALPRRDSNRSRAREGDATPAYARRRLRGVPQAGAHARPRLPARPPYCAMRSQPRVADSRAAHTMGVGACYGNHDSCSIDPHRCTAEERPRRPAGRGKAQRAASRSARLPGRGPRPLCVRSGFDIRTAVDRAPTTVQLTYSLCAASVSKAGVAGLPYGRPPRHPAGHATNSKGGTRASSRMLQTGQGRRQHAVVRMRSDARPRVLSVIRRAISRTRTSSAPTSSSCRCATPKKRAATVSCGPPGTHACTHAKPTNKRSSRCPSGQG